MDAPEQSPSKSSHDAERYTADDVASWRAAFRFPRWYHSLADFGYTDDELLLWRQSFDEIATDNRISSSAFAALIQQKYEGLISAERLSQKVDRFCAKFDKRGFIDFGEFVAAGILIDVDRAKEQIRQDGVDATFHRYAGGGFMSEDGFFQLMLDFHFTAATGTDVRKLVCMADVDLDGLVNLSDFVQWVESTDAALETAMTRHFSASVGRMRPQVENNRSIT